MVEAVVDAAVVGAAVLNAGVCEAVVGEALVGEAVVVEAVVIGVVQHVGALIEHGHAGHCLTESAAHTCRTDAAYQL